MSKNPQPALFAAEQTTPDGKGRARRQDTTKQKRPEAEVLADLLMAAHVAAWASHNPESTRKVEFAGVAQLGLVGYLAVAEELLRRGVRAPLETR